MARRKVLKLTPVLVTLNVLVLLIIASFYITRLVKYYLLENGTKKPNEATILVDTLIKKQSYLDLTKGLVLDEETNTYIYKGDVKDNYVLYSGNLYRIISIDGNKNIKMISENTLTLMYSGLEKGYNNSYVNKWLNKTDTKYSGVYENSLYKADKLLTTTTLCDDAIDDLTNITCEVTNLDNKVTLLSLYDYYRAGAKESFLNNGELFYTASLNSEKNNYFINNEGDIGINNITTKTYGVRPVITLDAKTVQIAGDGTESDPYIIEKHKIDTLADLYTGNYIEFDGQTYKVVSKSEESVKVVAVEMLKDEEGNSITKAFGSNNSYTASNTVGKYLNETFLNTLPNKDSIVKSYWYTGAFTLDALDYAKVYNSKVSTKVGMLTLGEFYIHEINDVFTISKSIGDDDIINIINEEGHVFGDKTTNKHNIRVSFNLSSDIIITNGIGTIDSPYALGVDNEKTEDTKEEEK